MSTATDQAERRRLATLSREALSSWQLGRLNQLLKAVRADNAFYSSKLAATPPQLATIEQLRQLPFTTKQELLPTSANDLSSRNRTYPLESYTRFHQTSGTSGQPMPVLDTAEDWHWWLRCWQHVLDAAEITTADRALLAFSFGPFIGFWSAFDALTARGVLAMPAGGMRSAARVEMIRRMKATVLLCTPSYAMHLAEVAAGQGTPLASSSVSRVIVAGEPGGSVPSTRHRIEQAWGALVIDHSGATEVGAWGYGDPNGAGLRVIESEFLAEFLDLETEEPLDPTDQASNGRLSHLVLTTLGRFGAPMIRYRTGDLVRPRWDMPGDVRFVHLEGGVLGRADDMMIIRGVNIFPSSVEQILHSFPEVVEFRLTARKRGEMDELMVEVEDQQQQPARIADELSLRLGLKVDVRLAPAMSLPRHESKAKRFVDLRNEPAQKSTGSGGDDRE